MPTRERKCGPLQRGIRRRSPRAW